MDIYLVGGAVRDELLGLPVKEHDWVVVGATPEALLNLGFQAVGKDFPVFLHPETHEEYALARTERKIAKGYKGFEFYTDGSVTLEQDLLRRDLTINAIAKSEDGKLIDPYHGQEDLQAKQLRHVSAAFSEDPVRILRAARFAAKLPEFQVAEETNQLMKSMVKNGEVDALVAERVWQELRKALQETAPERFFFVLNECNALEKLFPAIKQSKQSLPTLHAATQQALPDTLKFSALFIAISPTETKALCQRYRIPNDYSDLALLTSKQKESYRTLGTQNAEAILQFLKSTDAFRRAQRFQDLLTVLSLAQPDPKKQQLLLSCATALNKIDTTALQEKNLVGKDFAEALQTLQREKIASIIADHSDPT